MALSLKRLTLFAAPLMLFFASPAQATWSIVAVDPDTGEVGVAAASCSIGVPRIVALVPGKGAIVSQAATSITGREKARALVAQGSGAQGVLSELQKPELYEGWLTIDFPRLQYGVATLGEGPDGVQSGFVTGDSNYDWAGGEIGATFSAQGNTLRGSNVIGDMATAFRDAGKPASCTPPLAEKLLLALEAGRDAGGDVRCPVDASSLAAVLMVAKPGDDPEAFAIDEVAPRRFSLPREVVHFVVPYSPDPDLPEPVAELRARYDASKPPSVCPVDTDDAGGTP